VVHIVPYAFSGSPELVVNITGKLGSDCHCYLIQNHGALSLGADMHRLLCRKTEVENILIFHSL
jgi:hypothetical protein